MEDICLNQKPLKDVTKQKTKKRDEKKKAKLICCGNSTPGMDRKLLSFFYINLTWPFSAEIISDGIKAQP